MTRDEQDIQIRTLTEFDIGDVVEIDERLGGQYRPDVWEERVAYYLRRAPDVSVVAQLPSEDGGKVIGFMLGEVRSGEFGLEEPTGWIEVMGVDPDYRGRSIGRRLGEQILANLKHDGGVVVRTLVDESRPELAGFFGSLGFQPARIRPYVRRL